MNLMIVDGIQTDMRSILDVLGEDVKDFMWSIYDAETDVDPAGLFVNDRTILDGKILKKYLDTYEIQFIWGVFSAIKKDKVTVTNYKVSVRDNYDYDFLEPQHPNALFEIYCLDSSATAIVGHEELLSLYKDTYPNAKPYIKK